jgi:hypothetical protein
VFRTEVVLKKSTTMNKIIVLAFTSLVICGCNQNPPPADPHPANLVGKWKAEFTTKVSINALAKIERDADVAIGLTTEANGSANFEEIATIQNVKAPQAENLTINGIWKQAADYLIVEQPNGGFVAFRISSQSTNQLTVFSRTGQTI